MTIFDEQFLNCASSFVVCALPMKGGLNSDYSVMVKKLSDDVASNVQQRVMFLRMTGFTFRLFAIVPCLRTYERLAFVWRLLVHSHVTHGWFKGFGCFQGKHIRLPIFVYDEIAFLDQRIFCFSFPEKQHACSPDHTEN